MRRLVVSALLTALLIGGLVLAPGVTGAAVGRPTAGTTDASLLSADRGPMEQAESTLPPPDTGTGRRAVFSLTQQRVWVFSDTDTIVRTFLVSGRLDMPNPGTYTVWSRSIYACSTSHHWICMRYMIRFAKGPAGDNIGFHEIPRDTRAPGKPWVQTEEELGQPISDGCLRQRTSDAQYMWTWAAIGTVVVVLP